MNELEAHFIDFAWAKVTPKQIVMPWKVMWVFWYKKGILPSDFLLLAETINRYVYCETLQKLRCAIQNKRWRMLTKNVFSFMTMPDRSLQIWRKDRHRALARTKITGSMSKNNVRVVDDCEINFFATSLLVIPLFQNRTYVLNIPCLRYFIQYFQVLNKFPWTCV